MTKRLEITVRDGVLERLDEARGHEPRASFVKRALEQKLDLLLEPQVLMPSVVPVEKEPPGSEVSRGHREAPASSGPTSSGAPSRQATAPNFNRVKRLG